MTLFNIIVAARLKQIKHIQNLECCIFLGRDSPSHVFHKNFQEITYFKRSAVGTIFL